MLHDALAHPSPTPFVTHYSPVGRIELSGVTFANWVTKTANLFDDLGGDPAEPLALGLLETDPGHWVTMVWCVAAWFAGAEVVPGVPDDASFAVVGPSDPRRGTTTVACSLHPLGRGFDVEPDDATDYVEVLAQPDVALPGRPDDVAPAFPGVTFADLRRVPGRADRRLFVEPGGSWADLREMLVAPLLGGGSSVVTHGMGDDAVAQISIDERIAWVEDVPPSTV